MARDVAGKVCSAGAPGMAGSQGEERQEAVLTAFAGAPGTELTSGLSTFSALPIMPPVLWLTRLLHQAELDFLNGAFDVCAQKLQWIVRLHTWWQVGLPAGSNNPLDFTLDKVRSISAYAESGLDVFGKHGSYVPLLAYTFLSDYLRGQIENARLVEQEFKYLSLQHDDQAARRYRITSAANALSAGTDAIKQKIRDSFTTTTRLQDEIKELRDTLDEQHRSLLQASEAFRSAVTRKSGGCGFRDTLGFVMMVATVVSTAGAGVAAASAGMTALKTLSNTPLKSDNTQGWYTQIASEIKQIGEIVKPAGAKIEEFQESYNSARSAIANFESGRAQPELPATPSADYIKLVANKGDFDREIQKFRDLPEAQAYKRQMDLFVATCETRNNKIVEHDSLVRSIWDQWATIRAMNASTALLMSDQVYDYSVEDAVETLGSLLRQMKWDLLRGVSLLSRTLEYVSGSSNLIQYDDRSVASVAATIAQVEGSYLRSLEGIGVGEHVASGLSIKLRDVLTNEAIRELQAGRAAYFTIPTDHPIFSGRYNLTTKRIRLRQFPHRTRDLLVRFEHQGRSVMVFRDGSMRAFTHVSIPTTFRLDHDGVETDVGELLNDQSQKLFAGVSPYGPWKIQIQGSKAARQSALAARLSFDVLGRTLPF